MLCGKYLGEYAFAENPDVFNRLCHGTLLVQPCKSLGEVLMSLLVDLVGGSWEWVMGSRVW